MLASVSLITMASPAQGGDFCGLEGGRVARRVAYQEAALDAYRRISGGRYVSNRARAAIRACTNDKFHGVDRAVRRACRSSTRSKAASEATILVLGCAMTGMMVEQGADARLGDRADMGRRLGTWTRPRR